MIIRTASEGVSEDELGRDVRRLRAQWDVIKEKAATPNAKAPQLLYEEPDLLIKVVRDLFTEDFSALNVQGDDAWDTIHDYVTHVAPDLADRLKRYVGTVDVFTEYRIDEQILKALDRKVWLPSGGYLVIDRTEAMTVIDVNTGKFTGSGGNLEETVTRNNLEAAEEIVRQLRLRDIGGIIVIDFIDMVLESNRDLVLRRLTECLGRDRTRHQVAEVTSLGLVQMTRKRVGTGLLEAFSTTCEHCRGRGIIVSTTPVHAHLTSGRRQRRFARQRSQRQWQRWQRRRQRQRQWQPPPAPWPGTKQAVQAEEPAVEQPVPSSSRSPAEPPRSSRSRWSRRGRTGRGRAGCRKPVAEVVSRSRQSRPSPGGGRGAGRRGRGVVEQVPEPGAEQVPDYVEPPTEVAAEVAEPAEARRGVVGVRGRR